MSDTNTDPEVRLQGDIGEVTRVVLLVKNEYVFLKGRAANGTVTEDDLTGLETALTELKNLHPDVADSVEQTGVNGATIGTDAKAGPAAPVAEEPLNPGPGPDVPTNIGQPEPGPTDSDPIDNSNNAEPVAEDGQIGATSAPSTDAVGDEA